MNAPAPTGFGRHLVFVDESGDHGLESINRDFPLFALAFCVISKTEYVEHITSALRRLKVDTFGHDLVVLHEHDLRKREGAFARMNQPQREAFLKRLNDVITTADFTLITVVLDKRAMQSVSDAGNLYHLALQFGLERVHRLLASRGEAAQQTHFIVEARGRREDNELELEFRRICEGANELGRPLPFDLVVASKLANSEGLQLADMVARPVALSVLRPGQPNRAFEILRPKLWRGPDGSVAGYGLKCFPGKNEGPPGSPSDPSPNG